MAIEQYFQRHLIVIFNAHCPEEFNRPLQRLLIGIVEWFLEDSFDSLLVGISDGFSIIIFKRPSIGF